VDRIILKGIRALGTHGLLPEEQSRPQPFEVDVELMVDLAVAGQSDDLGDTIDYAALVTTVTRVVEKGHHRLLEVLAARIAEACRADRRVLGVTVTVRKLRPPVGALLDHVAVRIER
jgi:dihydroneopterin aldolase